MATGVFDLLHPGHLHFLESASQLGDELWVVVAADENVRRFKDHDCVLNQQARVHLVGALKPVTRALAGNPDADIYRILDEIRPDIIALGFDQFHNADRIHEGARDRGLDVQVIRLDKYFEDLDGTRKIISKIIKLYSMSNEIRRIESGDQV